MGSGEVGNCERRIACNAVHACGISPHHCYFDFTGVAESSARNFRSTELEDGVERKGRALFTRRRGVGEITGRPCRRQTAALISADRILVLCSAQANCELDVMFGLLTEFRLQLTTGRRLSSSR